MSSAVLLLVLFAGATFFGLLVVLPIVAVVLDHRAKVARVGESERSDGLSARLEALEQRVAAQEAKIAALKEMVEVNVLSIEERRALERRLGGAPEER